MASWSHEVLAGKPHGLTILGEPTQRVLDLTRDDKVMPVVGDKATVLFNRLVERMAREERQSEPAGEVAARNPSTV